MSEKEVEMDSDLRSRMVSVEHKSQDHSARLTSLEAWQRQRDIDSARHDEKWNAMEARIDTRFANIEVSLNGVQGSLTWVTRLLIGGIIMAAIAFMAGGGFKIG